MNGERSAVSPAFRIVWPIDALGSITAEPKQRTAVVLSVRSAGELNQLFLASGLAVSLAENGVELFALVGAESEQAHDALDWVIEEIGAEDVITTWHDQDDPDDIASFVVSSSRASGLTRIVVALDESTEYGARLRDAISNAVQCCSP